MPPPVDLLNIAGPVLLFISSNSWKEQELPCEKMQILYLNEKRVGWKYIFREIYPILNSLNIRILQRIDFIFVILYKWKLKKSASKARCAKNDKAEHIYFHSINVCNYLSSLAAAISEEIMV